MVSILIADDHVIVRDGLRKILSDIVGKTVIGFGPQSVEILNNIRPGHPDLLVWINHRPSSRDLEVIRRIRSRAPKMPILVLSMHEEDAFGLRVLREGVSAYLTSFSLKEDLETAVKKVLLGKRYVCPKYTEKLATYIGHEREVLLSDRLSRRESEILSLIALGNTIHQISERLQLSVKTVRTLRSRILRKCGLQNDSQITQSAINQGMVS
jgi:DNA-binding NarL/FixJ family response regulator